MLIVVLLKFKIDADVINIMEEKGVEQKRIVVKDKKRGSTGNRTPTKGFKVLCADRYTIEPCCLSTAIST